MNLTKEQIHLCWPLWSPDNFKFFFYGRKWPYRERNYIKLDFSKLGRIQLQLVELHCIGRLRGNTPIPCPQVKKTREMLCKECRTNNLTTNCAACRGETCLNPQAKDEYCNAPFVCYLAGFLPDSIKVGVTLKHRFLQRVFEQGADLATILTVKSNGKKAKKLEHTIAQMGIPDRLRKKEKRKGLYTGTLQTLLTKFHSHIQKLREKFSFNRTPQVLKLYNEANYPSLKRKPLTITLKKQKRISGKLIGVKGSWIVFQERTSVYALNSWNLAGWVVQKTDKKMKTQSLLINA